MRHPDPVFAGNTPLPQAFRDFMGSFYQWANRTAALPTPGAEAYAFTSEMLPLQDWKGSGEIVRGQLMATQPQVYVMQLAIPTGIAGIQSGQIALAQLMDMSG